jgi:EAL domain-containing protein (putative c-di-GMP-specific phosphodiesterase class I)
MSTSASEVEHLLFKQDLTILFQPIVNTTIGAELGFEALVRGPEGSRLHDAYTLFTAAADAGLLLPLEMLCREHAIRRFVALKLPGKLFLNVSPMALLDSQHHSGQTLRLLEQYGLDSRRVVIELSERYPMQDTDLLLHATRHYASMGLQIAIDDLGAGYSGLKLWSELTPDYVKIDRHFVAGVHADRIKREFVRFIRDISGRIGCQVIAEGVETADEYEALTGLGIRHLQGYYLGRPVSQPLAMEAARFQPSRRRKLLSLAPRYA